MTKEATMIKEKQKIFGHRVKHMKRKNQSLSSKNQYQT